jgi:predicted DsbA family dithiol-disulfide isomerase
VTIDVEIISDTICPWCFVGRRRLEKAIQSAKGEHDIRITWRPFELNPAMPREGMNRKEYYEKKFGGGKTVEEMSRRMLAVGAQEGIPFALDRIEKTPNTFDAHRLVWFASRKERGDELVNGLFRAFFTQGRDIGDRAVLADVGAEAGLDRTEVERFLASDEGTKEVRAEQRKARESGVDAVPTFIIGGKVAVTGAQSPEVFLEAFRSL